MRFLSVIFLILFFAGCSSVDELKDDYLSANDPSKLTFQQAIKTLKEDYLGYKQPATFDSSAKVVAYNEILKTDYKDNYQIHNPRIDGEIGMPEMQRYIFVIFDPNPGQADIVDTQYLVVIDVLNEKIVYSDVFTPPAGDPFYRYNGILKKIKST